MELLAIQYKTTKVPGMRSYILLPRHRKDPKMFLQDILVCQMEAKNILLLTRYGKDYPGLAWHLI